MINPENTILNRAKAANTTILSQRFWLPRTAMCVCAQEAYDQVAAGGQPQLQPEYERLLRERSVSRLAILTDGITPLDLEALAKSIEPVASTGTETKIVYLGAEALDLLAREHFLGGYMRDQLEVRPTVWTGYASQRNGESLQPVFAIGATAEGGKSGCVHEYTDQSYTIETTAAAQGLWKHVERLAEIANPDLTPQKLVDNWQQHFPGLANLEG